MKCIYYSCYPYEANDFKVVDAEKYNCSWRGSAYLMPFRLYKAAVCESTDDSNVYGFIKNVWEALDCPNYKGVEDYHKPFELENVKVFPTIHIYGATNSNDGVYEINGAFYTIGAGAEVSRHLTWEDAFDTIYRERGRYYLNGKDYSK